MLLIMIIVILIMMMISYNAADYGNLSIYIPWPFPPVWGVADNTKETNKNNGGFTPFFQQ